MTTRALKSGLIYFAIVFAAGFALGTIRVLLLEPHIGSRYAKLTEMPIMLLVIYCAARYIVLKTLPASTNGLYVAVGVFALALLLLLEFTLVLGLQGISMDRYLESRDAIAFTAYLASLGLFAFMPLILKMRMKRTAPKQP